VPDVVAGHLVARPVRDCASRVTVVHSFYYPAVYIVRLCNLDEGLPHAPQPQFPIGEVYLSDADTWGVISPEGGEGIVNVGLEDTPGQGGARYGKGEDARWISSRRSAFF
jgi:hypothetical protein